MMHHHCMVTSICWCNRMTVWAGTACFINHPFVISLPFVSSLISLLDIHTHRSYRFRMRSQAPPYPSFTWVLTNQSNPPFAPMYQSFHPCTQQDTRQHHVPHPNLRFSGPFARQVRVPYLEVTSPYVIRNRSYDRISRGRFSVFFSLHSWEESFCIRHK
jgi:hypothetical protein